MVRVERQVSVNVFEQDAITSRQVEVVIVICTNQILEAVHQIVAHHIAINHPAVLLRAVPAVQVQVVVTVINQIQQIKHQIVAVSYTHLTLPTT